MDLNEAQERARDEARCPAPSDLRAGIGAGVESCAKEIHPRDTTFIDRDPAKQVVLSHRLEYLARRVGGCQTEELLALLRGIMYEVLASRKY